MFFHFDVKFDYVLIRIWKKEKHFAIILFCKQSKSEIRIEKFWFSKFDFIMPKMLIQGLGETVRAQSWASRIPPSFSALKMGLETVSTNSWFLKKGIPEPG